jgi:MFS family permease
MMNLPVFRAFQSRNYRLYFYGQSVSLIGTWMQRTAVSWVVYTLTHSTFMLGLSLFATQFPSFLLSTLGGVVSDRYYRYRVLLITQIASLVQSILLAVLIYSGHSNVWMILSLGVVLGSINAFDVPARQALVYEMIDDKENLPNALALNSSMVNLARLIGPAIAGIVLHKLGEGVCFILNSVSFLAVIGSLLRMKLPPYIKTIRQKNALGELREGWSYLVHNPTIARPILMLAAMSLFVIPYATLLPVYAREIFHGNAATFGLIDSFIGVGAICGALYLATRNGGTLADRKKILRTNTIIFGIGLICFSHMTSFPIAMVFAIISGFGMMAQTTVTNTIIQTTVAPEMRGRVISYFAMSYFGMMPIGSLLVGTVSQYVGAPDTILFEGIAALVVVAIFWTSYLSVKAAPSKAAVNGPEAAPVVAANEMIKASATATPAQPASPAAVTQPVARA